MTSSEFRKQARENLAGRWGKAVFIAFIYILVNGLLSGLVQYYENSYLGTILNIAQIVLNVPLAYGLTITFLKFKRKDAVEFSDIFTEGFNNFGKAWCIVGRRILATIIPFIITVVSIIVLIIGIVLIAVADKSSNYTSSNNYYRNNYSSSYSSKTPSNDFLEDARRDLDSIERNIPDYYRPSQKASLTGLHVVSLLVTFIGFVGIIVGSILLYIKSLYYVQAELLSYDRPELTAKELIQESKKIMTNKRSSYFTLNLSFIGWSCLAACTFGIGYLWLLPYIQIANVFFYEHLINKNTNTSENTVNE